MAKFGVRYLVGLALQGVSITCDGFVNCCQVVIKFGIYDIVIVFVDIVIC